MKTHALTLEQTFEDGSVEYFCPTCGRRLIVGARPYKKEVLNMGDDTALHFSEGMSVWSKRNNSIEDLLDDLDLF